MSVCIFLRHLGYVFLLLCCLFVLVSVVSVQYTGDMNTVRKLLVLVFSPLDLNDHRIASSRSNLYCFCSAQSHILFFHTRFYFFLLRNIMFFVSHMNRQNLVCLVTVSSLRCKDVNLLL